MLTRKQHDLLMFIHERIRETGVCPSYDEMREALGLASKSGVHRLISALEERGFVRKLANHARSIETIRLPKEAASATPEAPRMRLVASSPPPAPALETMELPVMGRIAAGTAIDAIEHEQGRVSVPESMLGRGEHFVLEVRGDSMIGAGILDGDQVVIRRAVTAENGEIVVALIKNEGEATLKRFRRKGSTIALEPANPEHKTQIYGPDQVEVRGKLVGLLRTYH